MPSGRPAPALAAFADDLTAPVTDPDLLSSAIRPAFQDLAAAGAPEQSATKTVLQHLNGPVPAALDPATQRQHQPSGYSILDAPADSNLRHLGVPFASSVQGRVDAAFSAQPHSMAAAGQQWQHLLPNLLGRALVSTQCIASKAIYQANFHKPPDATCKQMQAVLHSFVGTSRRCEEASPLPSRLFPSATICLLPRIAGGLGVSDLAAHFPAMMAKPCWLLFRYTAHPWADLFGHEISRVVEMDTGASSSTDSGLPAGLPPGYHWMVTRPEAGRHLVHRVATESYRASLSAFLSLGVCRIVPVEDQDFSSVMLELTFQNPIPPCPGIDPAAMTTAVALTWSRLRDVRRAFQGRHSLPPDQASDLQVILAKLPSHWRVATCMAVDPPSSWSAISAPGDPVTVFEGLDPNLPVANSRDSAHGAAPGGPPAPRLWLLVPTTGRLQPLTDPAYVRNPAVPPRPALVVTKLKPRAAWDRADYNFAEEQRELPKADRRDLLEPWLVGLWEEMQLDPRVWGISSQPHQPTRTGAQQPSATVHPATAAESGAQPQSPAQAAATANRPAPAPPARREAATGQQAGATTQPAAAPAPAATPSAIIADQPAAPPTTQHAAAPAASARQTAATVTQHGAAPAAAPAHPAATAYQPEAILSIQHTLTAGLPQVTAPQAAAPAAAATSRQPPTAAQSQPAATADADDAHDHPLKSPTSLLDMDVRTARCRLAHRRALQRDIPGYRQHSAVWPALWPKDSSSSPNVVASATEQHLRSLGIAGLEERWRRPPPTPLAGDQAVDVVPAWLTLSRQPPAPAMSPRSARAAARNATRSAMSAQPIPAFAPSLRPSFPLVWKRLLDRTIPRPYVITAWLLLHGSLGCNAFLHHVQRKISTIAAPCPIPCRFPPCLAADCPETLSHIFLDCPSSSPAIDWLCSAWAALTGKARPPRTAAVLLADDLDAWTLDSPVDDPRLLALWTRLRVNVIGCIWQARCARDGGTLRFVSVARYAVSNAVNSVVDAIQRDWLRTSTDIRQLDNGYFCTEWWRGLDPKLSFNDFCASWTYGSVLCRADSGDAEANPPRPASLQLFLGPDLPVPFPA